MVVFCISVILISISLLCKYWQKDMHAIFKSFIICNSTFFLLTCLLVSGECDMKNFESVKSMRMEYISTKIIQCKYSQYIACYLIPPSLLVNIALIIIQIHHTVELLGSGGMLSDTLCYVAVVGFSVVLLFDSQRVSARHGGEAIHASGVVLLAMSAFILHWICVKASMSKSLTYEYIEVAYGLLLAPFMIFFVTNINIAIQAEYAVLFLFFLLSCVNLTVQWREISKSSFNYSGEERELESSFTCVFICGVLTLAYIGAFSWTVTAVSALTDANITDPNIAGANI